MDPRALHALRKCSATEQPPRCIDESFISLSTSPCQARTEPCCPVGLRASYITFISPFLSYLLSPQPHIFPTGISTENLETEHSVLFRKAETTLGWIHAQHEAGFGNLEESRRGGWVPVGNHREGFDELYLTSVFLAFSRGCVMMMYEDVLGCYSWEDG